MKVRLNATTILMKYLKGRFELTVVEESFNIRIAKQTAALPRSAKAMLKIY